MRPLFAMMRTVATFSTTAAASLRALAPFPSIGTIVSARRVLHTLLLTINDAIDAEPPHIDDDELAETILDTLDDYYNAIVYFINTLAAAANAIPGGHPPIPISAPAPPAPEGGRLDTNDPASIASVADALERSAVGLVTLEPRASGASAGGVIGVPLLGGVIGVPLDACPAHPPAT